MRDDCFSFPVTGGWLRDLASEPTPQGVWPCIRWDDQLLADQMRSLDVQAELGVDYNLAWGFFVDRSWPVPLENAIDEERAERLKAFVDAAHQRGIKVLSGAGIYSWGFDEVIKKVPGVSAGDRRCMCGSKEDAWDWQRRVLDFLMDAKWGLDGISMQSADQGRCQCPRCSRLSPAEYHADLVIRCADYVRGQRPEWTIGQASWGLRVDEPGEYEHIQRISQAVDYMVMLARKAVDVGINTSVDLSPVPRVAKIIELAERVQELNLILETGKVWHEAERERPETGKRTYAYTITDAVPMLMSAGVSLQRINKYLIDNPRRYFEAARGNE